MNSFHLHDPEFVGVHTHEIDGSNVEHTHVDQVGDDGEVIHVVEFMGRRYKEPAPFPDPVDEVVDPDSEG